MAWFKTEYFIYDKKGSNPVILEEGFCGAAFIFSFLWAFEKKMWLPGIVGLLVYVVSGSIFRVELIQFIQFVGNMFNSIEIGTLVVMLIPNFIYGNMGIEMYQSKLANDGYALAWTTREKDSEIALNKYNESIKVKITSHTSTSTKPFPSKESGETLFIRQKREINKKLKQKLITKKTADTQMKKAAELEEMRLIIENKGKKPEVKKAIKVKKITAKSSDDFDYVEKLKDITTLREEGAISQAEFRKLKKKIMDTI